MLKVYCAGPLFTPYERAYISQCGQALRPHNIDAYVPHEKFKLALPPGTATLLMEKELVSQEDLVARPLSDIVRDLLKAKRTTREALGLPPGTSAKAVFESDFEAIATSQAMFAIINGTEVDDGTACEIGIFYALMQTDPTKQGIVALHEDWRTLDSPGEGKGLNSFIVGCLRKAGVICYTLEDAVAQLRAWQADMEHIR